MLDLSATCFESERELRVVLDSRNPIDDLSKLVSEGLARLACSEED